MGGHQEPLEWHLEVVGDPDETRTKVELTVQKEEGMEAYYY